MTLLQQLIIIPLFWFINRRNYRTVELSIKIFIVFDEIDGATDEQTSSMEEIIATANKIGSLAENLKNILVKYEKEKLAKKIWIKLFSRKNQNFNVLI